MTNETANIGRIVQAEKRSQYKIFTNSKKFINGMTEDFLKNLNKDFKVGEIQKDISKNLHSRRRLDKRV